MAADAYSANGTVEPSKNAALLLLMLATKSWVPVGNIVAADAYSAKGTVEPSKNAALLLLMLAMKSWVPVGRSKDI